MNESASSPATPGPLSRGPGDAELLYILSRCAILTGICRFIPVPFVDDIVAERVRKHLVSSLLGLHARSEPADRYARLYRDGSGSCLGTLFGSVRSLILKPIKKLFRTIFFFLTIHDASLQMTRVFLLGRAIDLCLREGHLTSEPDAARVSEAFAEAFRGTDRRFLGHLMRQAGRGIAPVGLVAQRALRRIFGKPNELASRGGDRLAQLSPEERARLDEETRRLAATLDQEKVASFLETFDQRFLECLSKRAKQV